MSHVLDDKYASQHGGNVPDGTYLAEIQECFHGVSKKGTEYIRIELEIIDGDHIDQSVSCLHMITDNDMALKALRDNMTVLGYGHYSLTQLISDEIRAKMLGITVRIRIETKKNFVNVHFLSLINKSGGSVSERTADYESTEREPSDDLPF